MGTAKGFSRPKAERRPRQAGKTGSDGKSPAVLRRNMALALQQYGRYFYSGTQIDTVLAIAQEFAADGYVATRYRAGVAVQHALAEPLDAEMVRFLDDTLSPAEQQQWLAELYPPI